jgi:hypothetical protein
MEIEGAPWLFALVTAAWFWWMANRGKRTRTLWAVGGGAFGLVISALVIGLARARRIAFSDHQRVISDLKWEVLAAVVIAILGWMLTSSLHRHHLALWRKFRPASPSPEPPPVPAKPAATPIKPAIGKAQSSSQR